MKKFIISIGFCLALCSCYHKDKTYTKSAMGAAYDAGKLAAMIEIADSMGVKHKPNPQVEDFETFIKWFDIQTGRE